MKRYLVLLSLVLLMTGMLFSGSFVNRNTISANQASESTELVNGLTSIVPDNYVSVSEEHKLMVPAENADLYQEILASGKVSNDQNYGSFRVLTVDTATMQEFQNRTEVRDDMNVITLNGYQLDTTNPEATLSILPPSFTQGENVNLTNGQASKGLYIVQFSGPVQDAWYKKMVKSGVRVISYVATNGYIVQGDAAQIEVLKNLKKSGEKVIQYVGTYEPAFRTNAALRNAFLANVPGNVDVTIQVVNDKNADATIAALKGMAVSVVRDANPVLEYQNISLTVPFERMAEIARMDGVFGVAPCLKPEKLDERQGMIMSGNISGNLVTGGGTYLNWLASKGFSGTGQFDFVVDVTDDGLDRGSLTDINNEFRVGGVSTGASRVAYQNNYTGDTTAGGGGGHGNLNASIIFGYNNLTGTSAEDTGGYNYGLGIAPWVKVGNSKVFSDGTAATFTQTATVRLKAAYNAGARISSNSWGFPAFNQSGAYVAAANQYDAECQEHDMLVRDADASVAGNQEMTIVFAAGNDGDRSATRTTNTVSIPSTSKNVISVAAFENDRQTGTDGCGTANTGANSVNDVIGFSSRGPTHDGRNKPDIGAPGTHIQGAASRATNYSGGGVCDKYFPAGQTLYCWSSGTSHSTPGTAGAAALVRQYFINQGWGTPSPAMVKAFLTNSARYMSGTLANDTLPSKTQGMGAVNLGTGFDGVARVRVDQTQTFGTTGQTFTSTGTVADTTKPFRVSLAYTDAPGPTTGNAYVNNLDLEVTVGGVTDKGNVFSGANSTSGGVADVRNNLESVFLPAGTSGSYTVTVKATNIVGDGVPGNTDTTDQDFALVVYNGNAGGVPTPDFTIAATPSTQTVQAGSSTSYTVNIGSVNGFTGTVSLAATGLPSGATASFSPTSVAGGAGTATVTVATGSGTPAGNYTLTFTGTNGTNSKSASATLTVTTTTPPPGDQTVTGSNTTATAIPDNNTTGITSTINIGTNLTIKSMSVGVNITHTWRGDVKIDLVGPDGTTVNLKATSSSDSADNVVATYTPTGFVGKTSLGAWKLRVYDLAASDTGTLNSWNLSITGTPTTGGGTTGDFSVGISTATGTWTRGSSYTRTITVTRTGGLADPINLSYSVSRTGVFSSVTASVNPLTTTSTSSVLTFTVSSTTTTGPATVTVIGTDSTGRQRSTTLSLTIQ
ncbi:MAG: S8 family serine peptidase [Blastocatellia bacterium]|nr:S8 family serine peptidase [Blastocatellia bacterium]